jgi:hypothetical protein
MDTMRYAVLLRARNDLVERSSRLPAFPHGLALMRDYSFQYALDVLDPDLPCRALGPSGARFGYSTGMERLEHVQSWFARGNTYMQYLKWCSDRGNLR